MGDEMQKYLDKAEGPNEALPYIQKFNRKIIVVKYGGSACSFWICFALEIADWTLSLLFVPMAFLTMADASALADAVPTAYVVGVEI